MLSIMRRLLAPGRIWDDPPGCTPYFTAAATDGCAVLTAHGASEWETVEAARAAIRLLEAGGLRVSPATAVRVRDDHVVAHILVRPA